MSAARGDDAVIHRGTGLRRLAASMLAVTALGLGGCDIFGSSKGPPLPG
jgi:hypothetical protein